MFKYYFFIKHLKIDSIENILNINLLGTCKHNVFTIINLNLTLDNNFKRYIIFNYRV